MRAVGAFVGVAADGGVGVAAGQGGRHPGVAATGWDADHVVPVSEGGGNCTMANIRTLCVPCRSVTMFSRSSQVQTSPENTCPAGWVRVDDVVEQPATRASTAIIVMRLLMDGPPR